MIEKKELKEYARLKGLSLGNAEKDYLIDIVLLSISKHTKNELVFKGGTCLYKFHNLDRFSEDLDFSAVREVDVDSLIKNIIFDLSRFNIKAGQHRKKESHNSILITLRIEGPLYSGNPASYANLGVDINLKSKINLQPETFSLKSIYQEIPISNILCMKREEIFAEKIRALITRNKARDLFDLYFLLNEEVHCNKKLIEEKMEYYNKKFEIKKLISEIKKFDKIWEKELKGFTKTLPEFKEASKFVSRRLLRLYK